MNPITVEMLRDDWTDAPMPEATRAALMALPDETLDDYLDQAFRYWEDYWFTMLDSVRNVTTENLILELLTEEGTP